MLRSGVIVFLFIYSFIFLQCTANISEMSKAFKLLPFIMENRRQVDYTLNCGTLLKGAGEGTRERLVKF